MSYLYICKVGDNCKIGISNDVSKRMKQIQTGCPYPIEKVWHIELENARDCERNMHLYFYNQNTSGEWFNVNFDEACSVAKEMANNSTPFVAFLLEWQIKLENELKECKASLAKVRKENEMQKEKRILHSENGNSKKYYSIIETAKLTGLSQHYLRYGCRDGSIPHIWCGNKIMICINELMNKLDNESMKEVK